MTVKLNRDGYDHATSLVKKGAAVTDERDDWSEHQPSTDEENRFIEQHGYGEYGRWHLAVDDDSGPETKAHYKFPYGDFTKVHRCAVLSAESRAAQNNYDAIEKAAAALHDLLDGAKVHSRS
jgi:hypothetical protein